MSVMAWITFDQTIQVYVLHLGPGAYIALSADDSKLLRKWAQTRNVRLPTELTLVR